MPTPSHPRRTRRIAIAASLVPSLALVAAFTAPRDVPRGPARTLTITAKEFAFEAPDTIPAGVTTIRLLNRGMELHHVELIRLDAGKSMKDFFTAFKAGGPPPAWVHMVGGPNTPVPGGESVATLDVAPGRYAVVCFIPGADGKPHVMKGMAKELVAVAPKGGVVQAGGAAPTSTLVLSDYKFGLSKPLSRGTNVVRVRNQAKQDHEVLFVKLAPGKSAMDMAAWVEKQAGPPPGAPIGGTTGIESGGWNDVSLNLVAGEYAMLCFWPDAKDGKPHVMHGMTAQFTIR
jgi:hypothetical protein